MEIGLTYDELQSLFNQKLQSAVESFQAQRQAAQNGESPKVNSILAEMEKDGVVSLGLEVALTTILEVIAYNNEIISQSISSVLK